MLTETEKYKKIKRLANYSERKLANYVVSYKGQNVQYIQLENAERLAKEIGCKLFKIEYNGRIVWKLIKDYSL